MSGCGKPGTVPEYVRGVVLGNRFHISMIPGTYMLYLYVCMWGLYTLLLLLNSSCGATKYTRRNRHNKDHHAERAIEFLHHVHHSKGKAPKKKIVDNESLDGDSSDGAGRIICIYLVHHPVKYLLVRSTSCGVGFFIFYLVLLMYDVDHTVVRRLNRLKTQVQSILALYI